jgi:hypothetical protein
MNLGILHDADRTTDQAHGPLRHQTQDVDLDLTAEFDLDFDCVPCQDRPLGCLRWVISTTGMRVVVNAISPSVCRFAKLGTTFGQ